MTLRYLVIVERATANYGAYVPDVPGCITTGPTIEKTLENMREALTGHLELMQEDGDTIPAPVTHDVSTLADNEVAGYVEVQIPQRVQIR